MDEKTDGAHAASIRARMASAGRVRQQSFKSRPPLRADDNASRLDALEREARENADLLAYLLEPVEPAPLESCAPPIPVEGGFPGGEAPAAEVDEPESDGIPEVFRDLMLVDETPEKFTERMRRRMQYLKHMQIDGAKSTNSRALPDMTDEERDALADLERRNREYKWLD